MPLPLSPPPKTRDGSLPPTARSGRLDDSGEFSVEQGMARLTRLQEESMRQHWKQGQQCQALHGLLHSLMEEFASLRTLVKLQHEQMLQRLPTTTSTLAACSTNQSQRQVDVLMPEVQPGSKKVVKKSPEPQKARNGEQTPQPHEAGDERCTNESPGTPKTEEVDNEAKSAGITKHSSHGNGVILDFSRLPQTWTVSTYATEVITSKRHAWYSWGKYLVKSDWFEAIFVAFICISLVTTAVSCQWRGYYAAFTLGEREDDKGWRSSQSFFDLLEWIYCSLFLVEAVLRVSFLGREYVCVLANCFDTLIVLITSIQTYVFQPAGLMKNASFIAVARLVRLVRMMRFLKVVRFTEACSELRILARALSGCAGSLFWSMCLLLALIMAGAVVISQITLPYIEDESNPEAERRWSYEQFGTIPLSMMTLWECTFTGSWHRFSRRMIVSQSQYFAFFWVPYVVCINFSVMRLIGALFLKETMAVASVDAEKMSIAKVKRQREFAATVHRIFEAADSSGDGQISADEFEAMLYNEEVGNCFEKLELEVSEVAMLFQLLASDDGEADYAEFLEGALKLKQSAQIIDIIQLMHDNQKHAEALQTVYDGICQIANVLGNPLNNKALDSDLNPSDMKHAFVRGNSHHEGWGKSGGEDGAVVSAEYFDDAG